MGRALLRSPRAQRVLTNGLALCVLACGGAPKTETRDVPRLAQAPAPEGKSFRDVKVNADAKLIEVECAYGAYETCNALDDDCNGVIDDDCGYEGGDVQITVSWNSGADIDLYVTDPSGFTLFYNEQHKRSQIGGRLDHDARGDCRRSRKTRASRTRTGQRRQRAATTGSSCTTSAHAPALPRLKSRSRLWSEQSSWELIAIGSSPSSASKR